MNARMAPSLLQDASRQVIPSTRRLANARSLIKLALGLKNFKKDAIMQVLSLTSKLASVWSHKTQTVRTLKPSKNDVKMLATYSTGSFAIV
jgi:hypothetical protein